LKNGRRVEYAVLAAIILLALVLRLYNIDFGLPSLYDPDEPLFVIKGVELLTDQTLNPRWFGHPGTTTIYLMALTTAAVAGAGFVAGSWGSVAEFTTAVFADPAILFVPARAAMAMLGLASVWLTYVVGRRLFGPAVGIIASLLLALNSLHIAWSQVIRTDIHASVFMLGALYFAIRAAESGQTRHYLLGGLLTGMAVATKWPAATIFVAVAGAFISRVEMHPTWWLKEARKILGAGLAAVAGLIFSSPFLLIDWQTVLADLSGEARPIHLGHTGSGFVGNLASYFQQQVAGSMGWIGCALVIAGVAISLRSRLAKATLLPATFAFLAVICAQNLIWSRWILPAMPMLCIFAAVAVSALAGRLAANKSSPGHVAILVMVSTVACLPSAASAIGKITERRNDTRTAAAKWAVGNIPSGSSVVLEHLELSLRNQPWTILFPLGEAGCVDGRQMIDGGIRYEQVSTARKGSPIVDLGNVSTLRLESCRADYAILTYYDLYRSEREDFPAQYATYEALLAGGRTVAVFRPQPGRTGGPIVRVVALKHR